MALGILRCSAGLPRWCGVMQLSMPKGAFATDDSFTHFPVSSLNMHTTARLNRIAADDYQQNNPTQEQSSLLTSMKRGRGGRSSFSGIVATVFGATGFLGRYVVNQLGRSGSQIIIPYRYETHGVKALRLTGDLGQILYFPWHIEDEESIRKCIKYSNVVINLVGREKPSMSFKKLTDTNRDGARRIAKICREMNVERFVHVSALNASPEPTEIFLPGGSEFYKSKYAGEQAVLEEFPRAVIMRPSDIYGVEDYFINYYMGLKRRLFQSIPLWQMGDATVKQPVYVGDVARAIANVAREPTFDGKIIDAVGPKRYYLSDLCDWMFYTSQRTPVSTGYRRVHIDPFTRFRITLGTLSKYRDHHNTWERMERECTTDVTTFGHPDLEDAGVKPVRPFEDYAAWHLRYYAFASFYDHPAPNLSPPRTEEERLAWTAMQA